MRKKQYFYNGKNYDISGICQISGKTEAIVRKRLKSGWSIEEIVETPIAETAVAIEECWRGKKLNVVFLQPILNVFAYMQPTLGKPYVALPSLHSTGHCGGCRQYFIVTLENGKPLIVYPREFEIVGEVEE